MAVRRRDSPYIWVTWLTRLLVGENSCEWAAWFRAQHESWSWERVDRTFDQVAWHLAHTEGINESRQHREDLATPSSRRTRMPSPCGGGPLPLGASRTSSFGRATQGRSSTSRRGIPVPPTAPK